MTFFLLWPQMLTRWLSYYCVRLPSLPPDMVLKSTGLRPTAHGYTLPHKDAYKGVQKSKGWLLPCKHVIIFLLLNEYWLMSTWFLRSIWADYSSTLQHPLVCLALSPWYRENLLMTLHLKYFICFLLVLFNGPDVSVKHFDCYTMAFMSLLRARCCGFQCLSLASFIEAEPC